MGMKNSSKIAERNTQKEKDVITFGSNEVVDVLTPPIVFYHNYVHSITSEFDVICKDKDGYYMSSSKFVKNGLLDPFKIYHRKATSVDYDPETKRCKDLPILAQPV